VNEQVQGGREVTRKVFLALLALVLALSVGLVACGGVGEQEEEEEEGYVGEQEEEEEGEEEKYDLTITSAAGGSVTTPGEDTYTYDEGEEVKLVAEPDDGYRFGKWTGDVDDIADVNEATTTITVNDNYSIVANFEEAEVTFADPNLEAAVRQTIDKPTGPIWPADLEGLTSLEAWGMNITDLTGLQYCTSLTHLALVDNQIINISPVADLTNLTSLYLGYNQVTDISALVNLTDLTELDLGFNAITDILPLVDNEGLSTDDEVYLPGNPLNSDSINTYIPQLEARGVIVDY